MLQRVFIALVYDENELKMALLKAEVASILVSNCTL